MTQALFSVAIGLLLLWLLFIWISRGRSAGSVATHAPADGAKSLSQDLPPAELIERILDPRDLDFVDKESTGETVRLFERERRALALVWLRQTRRQVGELMSRHVAAVRQNRNLRPGLEIQLALHYATFLLGYRLTLALFYIQGPFQVRAFVNYVTSISTQLYGISEQLLGTPLSAESDAPSRSAAS